MVTDGETVQAGQHVIEPTRTEKLLGGNVSEDLKWREHILGSDQSLTKQLTSRVNGLLMVGARAPFTTRLSVAIGSSRTGQLGQSPFVHTQQNLVEEVWVVECEAACLLP